MQVTIIGLVITRRRLDVLDLILVRQRDAIDAAHPVALFIAGVGQVDPDRLRAFQVRARVDVDLAEPAILQHEYIDHELSLPQGSRHCHAQARSEFKFSPSGSVAVPDEWDT